MIQSYFEMSMIW